MTYYHGNQGLCGAQYLGCNSAGRRNERTGVRFQHAAVSSIGKLVLPTLSLSCGRDNRCL